MKTIAIAGTFDTKGEEFLYAKHLVETLGLHPLMIHTGVFAPLFAPDITNAQVASAAGGDIKEIAAQKDRAKATAILSKGMQILYQGFIVMESSMPSYLLVVREELHW